MYTVHTKDTNRHKSRHISVYKVHVFLRLGKDKYIFLSREIIYSFFSQIIEYCVIQPILACKKENIKSLVKLPKQIIHSLYRIESLDGNFYKNGIPV